jgi:hypothetical protein
MTEKRVITEGVLRPLQDPPAEPPGPRGTIGLNPLTGRPFKSLAQQSQVTSARAAKQ